MVCAKLESSIASLRAIPIAVSNSILLLHPIPISCQLTQPPLSLPQGFEAVFHYKSLSENASIQKLIASLDKSNGEVIRKFPRCLTKNSSGIVDIQLNRAICLELYQDYKELGRFMLRSKGTTIAAGIINKVGP